MANFLEKIIKTKEQEVQQMGDEVIKAKRSAPSLYERIKSHPESMQLIAEVKRASPSQGDIQVGVDIIEQAKRYEEAGAVAISVLTDATYFKGSLVDLRRIAQVVSLPILCKEFIIADKQIIRARNAGATVILLIVTALPDHRLEQLYHVAIDLDLEVLVEVHNEKELAQAEALGAKLIGVNNRNLHTFTIELATSERLATKQKKPEVIYISESGIKEVADVERLKAHYQAVLVGETLMREDEPEEMIRALKVAR